MTIAHTLATPAPTSRWVLLGSLALNLFLVGLMVALITREPPAPDRSPAGRIDGLASTLPAADGAKLRANFAANRAGVEGARKKYENSREAIRAVLRRARPGERSLSAAWLLTANDLALDRRARRATLAGHTVELTPKALAVLEYLMTHPDEAVTRERLLEAVWGWEYPAGTRTVDTRMAELRRALDDDPAEPRFIETIPGEGYRFIAPVHGEG